MNKVSRESAEVIEFLEQNVCTKEALSLGMLFKWEKEREYALRYLETTTGGLKNFFKSRAERGHSASNVIKTEEGTVVNQPPERRRVPSMKRRRAEEGGSSKKVIDLTSSKCCGKEISLEEVRGFAEKQKNDMTRAQFMQVYAARLFCLGRYEELKAQGEAKKKKEESLSLQKKLELEGELAAAMEQIAVKGKELSELKKEAETSREDHGYDMMAAGFERARKQAQFLYPDINFDNLDPVEVVHNGALVDDDEVDLEGGDDHNPHDDAAI
ncbi:hypothetical protein PIB30_021731 [Stylosanthes scabra]|uniref:Uncharacterized protein n=1 Tax=Stylosanthes scabra TaxID=79078 RepID=A0ABU6T8N4_9FABA|nr:hypothetical protein [Stylosanthes scabra]